MDWTVSRKRLSILGWLQARCRETTLPPALTFGWDTLATAVRHWLTSATPGMHKLAETEGRQKLGDERSHPNGRKGS